MELKTKALAGLLLLMTACSQVAPTPIEVGPIAPACGVNSELTETPRSTTHYCGIDPCNFGGWMNPACEWHDLAYTEGSWQQAHMSRKEVDDHFLAQLLYLAEGNPFKEAAAFGAYGAVRKFGWMFWEGSR